MPWIPHGISNGQLTTRWPHRQDDYFDTFPAAVHVTAPDRITDAVTAAMLACPTSAIAVVDGRIRLDRGLCILCGRCASIAPEAFELSGDAGIGVLSRDALTVGKVVENSETLGVLRKELAARVKHLRRSVHIRHVDAGSDGSDEWEVQALLNPVYDVHRLGIFFTASPRHADILLVTGIGSEGMREPLLQTIEGMPDPKVVIAVGSDAASGGLIGRGYTGGTGIDSILDVDVWVPGAPASPFSMLHGILLALGRVSGASEAGDGQ